jgi:DNA-binding GntR family transcriptional regulator
MTRHRPPAPWVATLAGGAAPSQATVLRELRTAILAGSARPGAPIPVDEVAARFSVSRIPVREALTTLVAEGLVEHQPRGAFVVTRLTRDELAELYVVRASLEITALGAAVQRATDDDVRRAADALEALQARSAAGDSAGHHRSSRAFHLALLVPCRMPRLLGMVERAWNVTEPGRPMAHASDEATATLAAEHVAMLAAFADRDAPRLVALATTHHRRLQQIVSALPPG